MSCVLYGIIYVFALIAVSVVTSFLSLWWFDYVSELQGKVNCFVLEVIRLSPVLILLAVLFWLTERVCNGAA